jgi:hypothetical protein
MFVCAYATGAIGSRLSVDALAHLGCAPADYVSSRAWCAVTSLPFTWGGLSFVGLLPFVALSVGATERTLGTASATGIFLGTHVFAGVAEALLLLALAPALGAEGAGSLLSAPDVGPSAGCFGCLGALIARRPPRQQALAAGVLMLFAVAVTWWRPDPGFPSPTLWLSDLAHPVAALAGYGYVRARQRARAGEDGR